MALTFTETGRDVWGSHQIRFGSMAFDASYPTGGEAFTAADFDLVQIVDFNVTSTDDAKYRASVDLANSKVKLYEEDGTSGIEAEEANGGNASAINFRVIVIGK